MLEIEKDYIHVSHEVATGVFIKAGIHTSGPDSVCSTTSAIRVSSIFRQSPTSPTLRSASERRVPPVCRATSFFLPIAGKGEAGE